MSQGAKPTTRQPRADSKKRASISDRACAKLQKQYDDALEEIESLKRNVSVGDEERALLREQLGTARSELSSVSITCQSVRRQRNEVAENLRQSVANTNRLIGAIHSISAHTVNPFMTSEVISQINTVSFNEQDDEIPF